MPNKYLSIFRKSIEKSQRKKIAVSFRDLLCSKVIKTKKVRLLDAVANYIYKKSSIDFILKKLMEFDMMKFILFDKGEMDMMKLIDPPSLSLIMNKPPTNKIENLWSKYESMKEVNAHDLTRLEEMFKEGEISRYQKNIMELI